MALTENPKLAMIPSGYGDYKVYSVLPSDGTGDFDFVRSSAATRVNKDGLIEIVGFDVPRLNYPLIDGVVSGCPSLLLEPQSLNKVTHSENIADGSWGKTNATVNSDLAISPDGTQNADKVNFSVSGGFARIENSGLSFVNSISFFIKYIDLEYILLFTGTSSRGNYINIKEGYVMTETLGGGMDVTIEKYPNDWLKIEATDANNGVSLEIYAANSTPTYSPITLNGSFYLWGCQAETNSYVTSYIPTSGSSATRSAETCNNAGDVNTFNDSEGVLMLEINTSDTSAVPAISLSNGTLSNEIEFAYFGTNQFNFILRVSGGTPNVIGNVNASDFSKFSVSYTTTDFKVYLNGFLIGSNTLPSPLSGLNTLDFYLPGVSNHFYGNTKQIQYFDTALTDTDLEELTSWTSFNEMAESQLYSVY